MTTIRFAVLIELRVLLLSLFVLAPCFLSAQITERKVESEVMPVEKTQITIAPSLKLDIHNIQISRRILLEPLAESAKRAIVRSAKDGPLLVGMGREMPSPYSDKIEPAALEWIGLNGAGQAAVLTVTSPGASALRLALSVTAMAEGIEIRFFSMEPPEKVYGPYTAKELLRGSDIQQDDPFWSPVIEGETIGMEIYLPEGRYPDELSFSIPKMSHLWTSAVKSAQRRLSDIGDSASCEIDIACNPSWVTTGNSVVKMIFTSYPYEYGCTGNLLADSDPNTSIPYFLTANHCISTSSLASTLNTYWFFQRATCGGSNPTSVTQLTGGATLKAHGTKADYSLLQLNDTPPAGAVFSGWSTETISPGTSIVGIHHPMGDLKKVSVGTADGYAPYMGSVDGLGDHIRVTWSSGITESGSSGSGIWITSGGSQYLIGTLHGGSSYCYAPTDPDSYGRFNVAYGAISQWIDPGTRDLVISSGTPTVTPSSVAPGLTVQLSAWTVQNQGAAATGAFNNGIYLSTDATITSSDTLLVENSNPALAAGASTDYSAQTLTIPANTAPGSYYIGILIDRDGWVTESSESNNYVSIPFTVSPPPDPDLIISSGTLTATPSFVLPGGTVQLSAWTVKNQGSTASSAFENGFYLSTDATITSSDTYLDGGSNPPLAAGASTNWSAQTLTIPANTAPGTYYIGILVDRANAVAEWNESNNYVSASFPVLKELQNGVAVTNLSGSYGSQTYYVVSIPLNASPSSLVVKTSGGTGDVDLYVKSASLPTTSSYSCRPYLTGNNETCTISNPSAGSNWYIMLRGYNAYSGVTLTATISGTPTVDLVIISGTPTLTPSSVVAPGGTVQLSAWTVQNQGTAASGAFANGFYLSTDATITSSDTYLYGNSNSSLAAGASTNWGAQTLTIPLNTAPGSYYIGILADQNNMVTETNEANNYVSVPLTVALPDLVISSGTPTVTPSSVMPGGTVQLSAWTVQNQGSVASGTFANAFYLSTDATITTSDIFLWLNSNSSLAAGASTNWGAQTLTIPIATATGSYYIGILADQNNVVTESDENNNYVSVPLIVVGCGIASNPCLLQNGVAVTNLSGSYGSQTYYVLSIPSNANPSSLVVKTSGGTGDVDLYVKSASLPTTSSYSCRSYLTGNNETCTISNPSAGSNWYIMLYGRSAYSDVSLTATYFTRPPQQPLTLGSGGAASSSTGGFNGATWVGYAKLTVNSGVVPYGTAVFSFQQNGFTVTEAGVPASPPTIRARVFIDYRSDVLALPGQSNSGVIAINTGIAVVNTGTATANVTYTLRDTAGTTLAFGNGTIAAGTHFAKFISQLTDVAPNFSLPSNFQTATQFASLEIASDQPLSVLALRGTNNQRNDFLITTTPIADLTQSVSYTPVYFPQFADGGGYTTSLVLLNTSSRTERGTLQILDSNGSPLVVNQVGGTAGSSFRYAIPAGGAFHFQTDGSPVNVTVGWARLTPDLYSPTPVGSGMFSYNPGPMLISESGIPSAVSTTHARVYVDLSGDHNTGLAIANVGSTAASISINAFQNNGVTPAGTSRGPLQLTAYGHDAEFADQFITGLPDGFTGVLDISSVTPFTALTMRSLVNERDDFLMTTFPIANANAAAPSPIVFPQVVDGGGYATQVILISSSGAASTTLNYFDEDGSH